MNEESKLIELFKKYPGIAARIRNGKSNPRLLQLTKTMLQPLSIILPNTWRNPWVGLMPMTKQHSTIKSLTININQ